MSSNSNIFTGTSRYSSDLQQVLTRAVSIASLPLNLLNSQLNTLQGRSDALNSLDGKFAAVLSAVQGISTAADSTTASVSDTDIVAAHSDPTALPGTYSIHVVSQGAPTSAMSLGTLPAVTDPTTQSITTSSSLTAVH